MKLSELSINGEAIVVNIFSNEETKLRLEEIGLTKGVRLRVIRFAPLGDPIEISVRGYYLALRKKTADQIEVNEVK